MFLYIKEIGNRELHARYGVPMRTLQNWQKEELQVGSWRGDLYRDLQTHIYIERESLKKIKEIFKQAELKSLIACVNGTMPDIMFFAGNYWEAHFEDCCIYEPGNVAQFLPEGVDLDMFKKAVVDKLRGLDMFTKYVLFRYVFDFWEKKEKDLDSYTAL